MVRKNTLTATDAQQVEEASVPNWGASTTRTMTILQRRAGYPSSWRRLLAKTQELLRTAAGSTKAVLALSEPRRIRDREHVRSVMRQPCLVCGRTPSDAHHLRFTQKRALGRKVSDEFTIPLCRGHHRELHRWGDEAAWWTKLGLDPLGAARTLWLKSHPLPERTKSVGTPEPTTTLGTLGVPRVD